MDISGVHNLEILRGMQNNRCLLSCTDADKVDMYWEDDGTGHQRWGFEKIGDNLFHIRSGKEEPKKYLSCTADGTWVDLYDKDDGSGRQRWKVKKIDDSPTPNTFLIQVAGGVPPNRKYLSCSADGLKVDLWDHDDENGRQRWQVQGVWKA